MRIILHADASASIGTGHVMRCLALASALRDTNEVLLAADQLVDDLAERARQTGVRVVKRGDAPEDADWIVVDGYHLDYADRALGDPGIPRLVLDDLGRSIRASTVLNPNLYATAAGPSRAPNGELVAGPAYALLRPDYAVGASRRDVPADGMHVLVTMGGADPANATLAVVEALSVAEGPMRVRVVIGAAHPAPRALGSRARSLGYEVVSDVPSLAPHMEWADLVISACGTTVLEIARFGRPMIGVILADNQQPVARAVEDEGLGVVIGRHPSLDATRLANVVDRMRDDEGARARAAERGPSMVDGRGAARVARILTSGPLRLHAATMDDADRLLAWRMDRAAREASFDRRPIDPVQHRFWLSSRIGSPSRPTWIGALGGKPVGVVRFDIEDSIATTSVALDPRYRAAGVGTRLVTAGCARLADEKRARAIDAWVRRGNAASEAAFQHAGFRLLRDDLNDRRLFRLQLSTVG